MILAEWRALGVAGRKRLAVRPGFEVALALAAVREPSLAVEIEEALETLRADGLAPTPFIDGNDLIEAGLTPGPRFKSILHAVYDAQLDGTLTDRSQALGLARSLGAEH